MAEQKTDTRDSAAEIFGRLFDSTGGNLPRPTAELILKANFPEADKERVDELLERKRDSGLSSEEEALLRDYLHIDSLMTVLKSKARRTLGQQAVA